MFQKKAARQWEDNTLLIILMRSKNIFCKLKINAYIDQNLKQKILNSLMFTKKNFELEKK
jgi:hypothetical protein